MKKKKVKINWKRECPSVFTAKKDGFKLLISMDKSKAVWAWNWSIKGYDGMVINGKESNQHKANAKIKQWFAERK